jgi:hypothetical protein
MADAVSGEGNCPFFSSGKNRFDCMTGGFESDRFARNAALSTPSFGWSAVFRKNGLRFGAGRSRLV